MKKIVLVIVIVGLGFYLSTAFKATQAVAKAAASHAAQIEEAVNN